RNQEGEQIPAHREHAADEEGAPQPGDAKQLQHAARLAALAVRRWQRLLPEDEKEKRDAGKDRERAESARVAERVDGEAGDDRPERARDGEAEREPGEVDRARL